MAFQKAVKTRAKGRVSLAGPSGSGKTFTALSIATNMGGKIAVLDTEHGSASKYADLFEFDVLEMDAPFHPDRYVSAIQDAEKAGYDILIIDSLSHAWFGKGGLLELVGQFAKRNGGGNSFAGWKDATPIHNKMIEAMLASKLHLIATMRSKHEYAIEENDKGKKVPRKVGLAPVQRDGMEYEFDVFAEIDLDHNLVVSKSRCPALDGAVLNKAGKDFADVFSQWLTGAEPVAKPETHGTMEVEIPAPATLAPKGNKPKAPPEPMPPIADYATREGEYPLPTCLQKNGITKADDIPEAKIEATKKWAVENGYPDLAAACELIKLPF
jgi:hypothetical protein